MLRALAKSPRGRYESAAELMGALEAAAAGRVDERKRPPSVEMAVATPAPQTPAAVASANPVAAVEDDEPKPSRRRLWVMIGAVVVVLVAAGAAYTELSRSGASPGGGILPTPGATRSPGAVRVVSVTPPSPLKMGSPITVSGRGLDPRREAGAGVLQGNAVHPIGASLQVQESGAFSVDGNVPADLVPGAAAVVACNFVDAKHTTDLTQCIQLNVTVTR
jgi:hypothetical protein